MPSYRSCEVCGARRSRLLLRSPRLDGPLVRCPCCGFVYVGVRTRDFTFAAADPDLSRALGERVERLQLVDREVEEAEAPWREAIDRERLERLGPHVRRAGRLLDVGSALGGFLAVARERYAVEGIEPDPGTSAQARARGLSVRTGGLADVPGPGEGSGGRYDAVTMFHVIEHLDSPRAALTQVRELLAPGGILLLETPTIDNPWFALAPGRWRQLIPDHYTFFSRATLERLLRDTGFEPLESETVARTVSLRFAADRLRRAGLPGARRLTADLAPPSRLGAVTVRLDPRDILTVTAASTRRSPVFVR